jgi:hypothetical protein
VRKLLIKLLLPEIIHKFTAASWLLLWLLFVVSGPFGTYQALSHVERGLFWAPVIAAALLFGISLRVCLEAARPEVAPVFAAVAASVVVGVALGFAFPFLEHAFFSVEVIPSASPAEVATVVILLGIGTSLMRRLVTEGTGRAKRADPRLLARLPAEVKGEILHLSVDDHYVEVATDRGRAKVLMRLADAIDEAGEAGARVHRSHWVAKGAVVKIERLSGRTFLHLKNGSRVPVSRGYQDALDDLRAA